MSERGLEATSSHIEERYFEASATKRVSALRLSMTRTLFHGSSLIRHNLWQAPAESVASSTSPGYIVSVSPLRVVNSRIPASVKTYCATETSYQRSAE